jgi:polysaccharide export outer membrane protein
MRKTRILILGLILVGACSSNPPDKPAEPSFFSREDLARFLSAGDESQHNDYIISMGDVLDVVFMYHTDLTTRDLIVRSDGRISLPYLGDVMAAGLRPMELDSVLTVRFEEILRQPDISVIIRKSAEVVYVLGEVDHPGGYPFTNTISLVQSLALAGGQTPSAKLDRTVVIRREGMKKIVGVEVDLKAIIKGENIQNDFLLRKDDIVYVPKRGINSLSEFIQTVNSLVRPPFDIYKGTWDMLNAQKAYEYYRARLNEY